MPYFRVILSGSGISYPFVDAPDPVIGFFTTRDVRARNLEHAHSVAKELVLSEWRPGGTYATDNAGAVPSLAVENSFSIGLLKGIFGRKPAGYSFYTHDD
jgi:hypothetical protein